MNGNFIFWWRIAISVVIVITGVYYTLKELRDRNME